MGSDLKSIPLSQDASVLLLLFFVCLFVCFYFFILWLCWVFVSVRGLSLVAASGGHSSLRCTGLSLSRPLLLWSTGSRRAGSVIVAHWPSCSTACGILPDQGSNPCPLHWQADSQPLRHQGSPFFCFEYHPCHALRWKSQSHHWLLSSPYSTHQLLLSVLSQNVSWVWLVLSNSTATALIQKFRITHLKYCNSFPSVLSLTRLSYYSPSTKFLPSDLPESIFNWSCPYPVLKPPLFPLLTEGLFFFKQYF